MKHFILLFSCSILFSCLRSQPATINLGNTIVETSTLFSTTNLPWELKYGPGDSLWMTTKEGRVYRINTTTGVSTLLLDYSENIYQQGEAGMLGMAFDNGFANTGWVFIAYTYSNAGNNFERLSRFTYANNALSAASELVLIDGIAATSNHDGSRLLVLPDNTILMTTGDALNTANAQNNNSLNGKILRVGIDGSIPADNPVAGSYVYTIGHRNPQGLVLHPNGKIYETEHGPNNNDEFQIIEKGRNYGWPNVEGFCDDDIPGETAYCTANNIKAPLASWNPVPGGTWAPNDLIFYNSTSIPEFNNSLLVTFLKTNKLRRITLNAAGDAITGQTDFFVNQWGRLRDITSGPDGTIYIATNTSPNRIIKIKKMAAVPVTVSNFNGICGENKATLKWATQTEINNKQFLLFRSIDNISFALAGNVLSKAPTGNSNTVLNYTFVDSVVTGKNIFYKLVNEDRDGRREEGPVISLSCGNNTIGFSVSPNPSNGQSTLQITGSLNPVWLSISNMAGQIIYQNKTNGRVNLPVKKWAAGVYNIIITSLQKQVLYQQKLVVY